MALYLKQDFTPPVLSRKWIAMKFRPNMLIYNRQNVVSILESGLMFREDSIEVEQETTGAGELWSLAGGVSGWLTRGERVASVAAVSVCVAVFPPKSLNRSTLFHLAAYLSLPLAIRIAHRRACKGTLPALLAIMRDYLTLARRAAACLREYAALRAHLACLTSAMESTKTMLCRQQSELAVTMSRASSALLGNTPWLRSDVAWDAVVRDDTDNLMKIHHAFLVVQSTLLKHIAMAHFIPSAQARKIYKNHNERIYWIHNVLIKTITDEFTQNFEALERMYRLLKNYGNIDSNDMKKPGRALNDNWVYSEVHNDIARANLELKLALNKCNNLDMFLDACALQKQDLDLEVLNQDIDALIGYLTKSLGTAQSSQIRLRKLLGKLSNQETEVEKEMVLIENEKQIEKIEDKEPETKDEVFYFIKTDDDASIVRGGGDITTAPGKKERDTTKIVLNELRRKLVNREDVMRERERQALVKTMPEFKDNVPEFPRQINIEEVLDRKGYIKKIHKNAPKQRLFRQNKIQKKRCPYSNIKSRCRLKTKDYSIGTDIQSPCYDANSKLNVKTKLLTISKMKNRRFQITMWYKKAAKCEDNSLNVSDLSDSLSDAESNAVSRTVNQAVNVNNMFKKRENATKREDDSLNYSDLSDGLSDAESSAVNAAANVNNTLKERKNGDARNYKVSKKDLEWSPSSSEDDSDYDVFKEKKMAILNDVRRYRVARKKNYPNKRAPAPGPSLEQDESLRPSAYSLGAGLAMASVLQGGMKPHLHEEVFVGDGEVSPDSGNDDDQ